MGSHRHSSPTWLAGHSYGEFAALYAAGVLDLEELLLVSEARGRFIVEAAAEGDLGTMAAVQAPTRATSRRIAGIRGPPRRQPQRADADDALRHRARRSTPRSQRCRPPDIDASSFRSALPSTRRSWRRRATGSPSSSARCRCGLPPFPSTRTPRRRPIRRTARRCVRCSPSSSCRPVEFVRQIEAMYRDGARIFVGLGPKSSQAEPDPTRSSGNARTASVALRRSEGGLGGLLLRARRRSSPRAAASISTGSGTGATAACSTSSSRSQPARTRAAAAHVVAERQRRAPRRHDRCRSRSRSRGSHDKASGRTGRDRDPDTRKTARAVSRSQPLSAAKARQRGGTAPIHWKARQMDPMNDKPSTRQVAPDGRDGAPMATAMWRSPNSKTPCAQFLKTQESVMVAYLTARADARAARPAIEVARLSARAPRRRPAPVARRPRRLPALRATATATAWPRIQMPAPAAAPEPTPAPRNARAAGRRAPCCRDRRQERLERRGSARPRCQAGAGKGELGRPALTRSACSAWSRSAPAIRGHARPRPEPRGGSRHRLDQAGGDRRCPYEGAAQGGCSDGGGDARRRPSTSRRPCKA